jgi:nicotinamidase-related amidase
VSDKFDRARTCLLLFDFLRGHTDRDAESHNRFAPVIANASMLLDAARKARSMVAYARADHRADRQTSAAALIQALGGGWHVQP